MLYFVGKATERFTYLDYYVRPVIEDELNLSGLSERKKHRSKFIIEKAVNRAVPEIVDKIDNHNILGLVFDCHRLLMYLKRQKLNFHC